MKPLRTQETRAISNDAVTKLFSNKQANENVIHSLIRDSVTATLIPIFTHHNQKEQKEFMRELELITNGDIEEYKEMGEDITELVESKRKESLILNKQVQATINHTPLLMTNLVARNPQLRERIIKIYNQNKEEIDKHYRSFKQHDKSHLLVGNDIRDFAIIYQCDMNDMAKLVKTIYVGYHTELDQCVPIKKQIVSQLSNTYDALKNIAKNQQRVKKEYQNAKRTIEQFKKKQVDKLLDRDLSEKFEKFKKDVENQTLTSAVIRIRTDSFLGMYAIDKKKQITRDELKKLQKDTYDITAATHVLAENVVAMTYALTLEPVVNTLMAYDIPWFNSSSILTLLPQAIMNINPLGNNIVVRNADDITKKAKTIELPKNNKAIMCLTNPTYLSTKIIDENINENDTIDEHKKELLKNIGTVMTATLLTDPLNYAGFNVNELLIDDTLPHDDLKHYSIFNRAQYDHIWNYVVSAIQQAELDEKTKQDYWVSLFFDLSYRQLVLAEAISKKEFSTKSDLFELKIQYDKQKQQIKELTEAQSTNTSVLDEEKAIHQKDINELKEQLKQKQKENEKLKQQNQKLHKKAARIDTLEQKNKELTAQYDELSSVNKELQYKLDNPVIEEEKETVETYNRDEFIKELDAKNVVIIGGHEHWRAKMQLKWPNAKIIAPENSSAPLAHLTIADVIVFNTAILNHPLYHRAKNELKKNNKNYKVVTMTTQMSNIDNTIDFIYEECNKETQE